MTITDETKPELPFPPPLLVSDDGSFAQTTVCTRLPRIARQVMDSGRFSEKENRELEALVHELPFGVLRNIRDDGGPDVADWAGYLAPFAGHRWFDIPWFLAETYFYRRLLEATGYFGEGRFAGVDPGEGEKRASFTSALPAIRSIAARAQDHSRSGTASKATLNWLLHRSLWGNQADMALWPAGSHADQVALIEASEGSDHILVDDSASVTAFLTPLNGTNVHFVLDNAGFELCCDLLLADRLLGDGIAHTVRLHCKPHPLFVSDALKDDVLRTVADLRADLSPSTQKLGNRLFAWISDGRMVLDADFFWTSPLPVWQMPYALRDQFAAADVVFFKGDANYRRLLGDRHWPFTAPFAKIVDYFPAPLVALRTLKSEVGAGLSAMRIGEVSAVDPNWLVDGRFGVIQYHNPAELA